MFKASDSFGMVAGSYAIAAGYLSESGRFLVVPPMEPGAVDEVGVTVAPLLHRTRVTVTFGRVTVEDAAALGGRLGLCLAVGDQTAHWPPEGAADVEDGKVFHLDQRFDLVLNPSSELSVAVTGEDAAGAPAGVVSECYLGLDGWGAGDHDYRSRLRAPGDPERPGPDADPVRSRSTSLSSRPCWTPEARRPRCAAGAPHQPMTRRLAASASRTGVSASAAGSAR